MRLDVIQRLPEEACGILAGLDNKVQQVIPVTNELHSPVRYRFDPSEQLLVFRRLEEMGLEMVGIYHSHPTGPARPSPTDVAEFSYPGVINVIWSPAGNTWQARGFRLDEGRIEEVSINVDSSA